MNTHDLQVSPDTFAATLNGARAFDASKLHNIALGDLACLREFWRDANSYSGRTLTALAVDVEESGEQRITVTIDEPLQDE